MEQHVCQPTPGLPYTAGPYHHEDTNGLFAGLSALPGSPDRLGNGFQRMRLANHPLFQSLPQVQYGMTLHRSPFCPPGFPSNWPPLLPRLDRPHEGCMRDCSFALPQFCRGVFSFAAVRSTAPPITRLCRCIGCPSHRQPPQLWAEARDLARKSFSI